MDRKTRKANLKKLQEPATTTKQRTTRSSKQTPSTTTLSEYFNTQENPSNGAAPDESQTRLPLPAAADSDDPFAEPKHKKTRESKDAPVAKPKKAPKLKSSAPARRGRGTGRGRSKQPSISDFLRNEQLFAEVTAQHCVADNFSPDDIEMALALSKSEAEKYGALRLEDTVDREGEEEVVNLLDDKANQTTENIRRKLQKYGFRTAAKEDYNMLSIGVLPAAKRGKRCRWANKFTALTLRNPEEQLKKVDAKVAALMAQQVRTKLPSEDELQLPPFDLISPRLQQLKATARIHHEPSEGALPDLCAYYVLELMAVSRTPAHHLLKSFAAIPGRDLSPKRPTAKDLQRQQQLEQVYAELETFFGEEEELDKLEQLLVDNMVQEEEGTAMESESSPKKESSSLGGSSPTKEPPDKRSRLAETELELKVVDEKKEQLLVNETVESVNGEAEKLLPSTSTKSCSVERREKEFNNTVYEKEKLQPSTSAKSCSLETRKSEYPSSRSPAKIVDKRELQPRTLTKCYQGSPAKIGEREYPTPRSPATATLSTSPADQKEKPQHSTLTKSIRLTPCSSAIKENEKENLQPSSLSLPTQSTRCTSPDLFADSDEDEEEEMPATLGAMQSFSLKVYKNTSSTEINCYEIYSSDEVKTSKEVAAQEISTQDESIVDLTEEQDSPELPVTVSSGNSPFNVSSGNSLLEQQILALSPAIAFEEDPEELDCTLAKHTAAQQDDCVISPALYAKYAHKEQLEQDLESCSFNISKTSSNASFPSTSFHLATIASTSFDLATAASTSFDLATAATSSSSKDLARSFSLTQSSNLEHSFKSPLSRRSVSFTDRHLSFAEKPISNCSHSDASIDLTQNSAEEDEDEGVLLSDDEINYSIWQADKTHRDLELEQVFEDIKSDSDSNSPLAKRKTMPYFKTLEDLDAFLDASPAVLNKSSNFRSPMVTAVKSSNSRSPNKSALSKERAEFGILDAAISQPFTLSQLPSEKVDINWDEASFLETPPEPHLKRYSSCSSHRFKDLVNIPNPVVNNDEDELDEFDRMVLQHAKDEQLDKLPTGMDQLLLGDIQLDSAAPSQSDKLASGLDNLLMGDLSKKSLPAPVETLFSITQEQLEVNGQVYTVRACQTPKPDFVLMPESELLKHLYNYGIKPLKRNQAVKLLEFIYNQTHPIMRPLEQVQPQPKPLPRSKSSPQPKSLPLPRSKSTPVSSKQSKPTNPLLHTVSNDCLTPTEVTSKQSYKFRDACGTELLRFSHAVAPALCDDFEFYVLQTNVSKKTPQPLLPLHIAWHNLLCANPTLHESVLMYEPIDLQEIYQYLKQLGHRYDPKDLKCFFDRRCIIFRYELAPPNKQVQRHIRKKPKKTNAKF